MAKLGRLGKYQLIKRIAVGGMSEIFLASQGGLHGFERAVIVKCIREDLSDETEVAKMFLDEARIAACLKHSNIVHLYDVGEDGGNSYLAMEYIFGRDLMQIGDRARALGWNLPVQFVLKSMCDALAGLHYAHEVAEYEGRPLLMVHRDVSPQNIIVSFDGTSKLVDFGIAKAEARLNKTRGGVLKGKYAYMSPEQVRGKELDHRSDQFSMAVVYYEVLTGTRLFQRDTDYSTMEAVDRCEVPPIRVLRKDVPRRLVRVLRKAMRPKPKRRFNSCRDMERMLHRLLKGSAVEQTEFMAEYMRKLFGHELVARDEAIEKASGPELEILQSTGFELLDRKDTRINPIGEAPLAHIVYNEVLAQRQDAATQIRQQPTAPARKPPSHASSPQAPILDRPALGDEIEDGLDEDTDVRKRPTRELMKDWRFMVLLGTGFFFLLLFLMILLSGPEEVDLGPEDDDFEEIERPVARPGEDGWLILGVGEHVRVEINGEDQGLGAFRRPFPKGKYKVKLKNTKTGKSAVVEVSLAADAEETITLPDFL
jgi:serine/threonine-protein kinase